MKVFLFIYDLRHESDLDYQALYDELSTLRAHHLQDSAWLIATDDAVTARTLRVQLGLHMHARDRKFVVRVHRNQAINDEYSYEACNPGTREWLLRHQPD